MNRDDLLRLIVLVDNVRDVAIESVNTRLTLICSEMSAILKPYAVTLTDPTIRIPLKVRMLTTVRSTRPFSELAAEAGKEYQVSINTNGSVFIPFGDGINVGIKTGEYEVVKWQI